VPRIVSGTGQSVNQALLEGLTAGRGFAQANAQQAEQRLQTQALLQKAMLAHKMEQARALKATNDAAAQGDLQAIQAQAAEGRASGQPPNRQFLMDLAHSAVRIQDPKLRQAALGEVAQVHKELQADEQKQAAMKILEQGVGDGHIDAEALKMRMDAGEKPENIAQEAMKIRAQRIEANTAMKESADALQQAEAFLAAAPKGTRGRKLAEHALEAFKDSPTAQAKPGMAETVLKRVRDALVLSVADEKQMRENFPNQPAPGLGGMTVGQRNKEMSAEPVMGFGGPNVQAFEPTGPQAHRTLQLGKVQRGATPPKEAKPWPNLSTTQQRRAERSLTQVAKSGGDMRAALQELGISDPDSIPSGLSNKLLELRKQGASAVQR
jgi:hypothetical protein